MTNDNLLPEILHSFMTQLPTLLACLIASIIVFVRWRQGSRGSLWAILGFGLSLVLCFAIPVGQALIRYWVTQSGDTSRLGLTFTALGFFWSTLRGLTYALLLVAVFAGRPLPDDESPSYPTN